MGGDAGRTRLQHNMLLCDTTAGVSGSVHTCSQRRSSWGRGTHSPAAAPTSLARLHSAYSSPTDTLSLSVELQHAACSTMEDDVPELKSAAAAAAAAPLTVRAGRADVCGICRVVNEG